jgi:hypothetical protein
MTQQTYDPNAPASKYQDGRAGTLWYAYPSDQTGKGYYVDADQSSSVAGKANPYSGDGLLAVLANIATTQAIRSKIETSLDARIGATARAANFNLNAQADPTWNSALAQVIAGTSVTDAFASVQKGQNGLYNAPDFTADQLTAAKAVSDGL